MSKYIYIFLTILLTTYGQLIVKWRISLLPNLPTNLAVKFIYLTKTIFVDIYIISGFFAAYLAALCWMSAIKTTSLSVAYPFMSLTFPLVIILASLFFSEPIHLKQIIGMMLLVISIALLGV